MKQADLIRTALALRYASVLTRGLLDPIARHAVALEADRRGDPPPSTVALTNHLIAEAEAFLAGRHAALEIVELRAELRLAKARAHDLQLTLEHVSSLLSEGDYDDAEAALQNAVEPVEPVDDGYDLPLAEVMR